MGDAVGNVLGEVEERIGRRKRVLRKPRGAGLSVDVEAIDDGQDDYKYHGHVATDVKEVWFAGASLRWPLRT